MTYNLLMKAKLAVGFALGLAVLTCAGFRFHSVNVPELKPKLTSVGGPPGPGCGTGSTLTWIAVTSSKELPMSLDKAESLVKRDLAREGYERLPSGTGNLRFRRTLGSGGGISVFLQDWPGSGRCMLYCSIGVPKVTWYGLRIPSP